MKSHLISVLLWIGYIITSNPYITICSKVYNDASTFIFPQPPTNLRHNITVIKSSTVIRKRIEVVIIWDQPRYGSPPTGYDLMFVPTNSGNKTEDCKNEFTAYHAPNIPKSANSWIIPYVEHGIEKKEIHFGCSYKVTVSSFPYSIPKENYTAYMIITIPDCIEGVCTCQDPLPPIENLRIQSDNTSRNLTVSWTYDSQSSIKYFQVTCAQFAFQYTSGKPHFLRYDTVRVNFTRKTNYETRISLSRNNQQKITIKAIDVHLCNASTESLINCEDEGSCYCTTSNLSTPSDIKIASNSSASATIISWHYPGSELSQVNYFLVTIGYEYPRDRSMNKVDKYQVSIPENVVAENVTRVINTTLFCSTNRDPISIVKINAVDYKGCYGPSSKQFSFNCHGLLVIGRKRDSNQNEIAIAVGAIIIFVATISLMVIYIKYQRQLKNFIRNKFRPQNQLYNKQIELTRNAIYIEKEIVEARSKGLADLFEISNCRLILGEEIGKGAFGRVYVATADTINGKSEKTTVAVKQIKDDATDFEKRDFLEEIKMMKQVGHHPNVITMLACCTLQQPYCMVMEYVSGGDLLHYLKQLRKHYVRRSTFFYSPICQPQKPSAPTFFTSDNRQNQSSEYLLRSNSQSSCDDVRNHSIVHTTTTTISEEDESVESDLLININPPPPTNYVRLANDGTALEVNRPDLTPCCIDSEELHMFALQISKGMNHLAGKGITHRDLAARNVLIDENNILKISDFGLSRTGIYVTQRGGKVPLRWLSIEAIRDNVYTTKSDVWAFGIVLWEICTLGGFPYACLPDTAFPDCLINGHRLEKPDNCSEEMYLIMESCWNDDPYFRPTFSELCDSMERMKDQSHLYVNFDMITNRPLPPEEVESQNSRLKVPVNDKIKI